MGRIVTLLTDFGEVSPFTGIIKGVIKTICDECELVTISNDIPSFDIIIGAYVLRESYKYFPKGTVHLVVIDPGVGTKRKCIAIRTKDYWFVGPDNGVLWPAAKENEIVKVYELIPEKLSKNVSYTFHARDVFAPAAARIAKNENIKNFGKEMKENEITKIKLEEYAFSDKFGNVELPFQGMYEVVYKGKRIPPAKTFGEIPEGEIRAIINSRGRLELAMNKGSAYSYLENPLRINIDGKEYVFKIKFVG